MRDFAAWAIIFKLKKRKGETFDTFYFEIPLVVEAVQRYLQPREAPGPTGGKSASSPPAGLRAEGS